MFTWICPQCGREVPPAYNECPDCTGKGASPAAAPPPPPPGTTTTFTAPPGSQYAPQATQYAMPVPQYAPTAPQYAPPGSQYAPAAPQYAGQAPQFAAAPPQPRGMNLPPWLMSILFAAVFLALFAGAYFGIRYFNASDRAPVSAAPKLEGAPTPTAAGGAAKPNNTLQKYVEVIGLRLTEDPKHKAQARFVVVNHSGAEIADLAANVNLWARTAKSDEEAVGSFSFKVPSLGPYETKDLSSALTTKLRVYELPDWQNLTAEVQITSPAQ